MKRHESTRLRARAWPIILAAGLVAALLVGLSVLQNDQAEAIGEPIAITEVDLADAEASLTIENSGPDAIDLSGWWVCNFPLYWPIPDGTTIEAGASLQIHAGAGADTADEIYADGGYGALTGGAAGEVAIYNSGVVAFDFSDADAIVAYVGWDGGLARKAVAQAAGLWGEGDVASAAGDVIELTGDGTDADSYAIQAQAPAPAPALTYGTLLSGAAQPTPVETAASGGFGLETSGGVATYTLAVVGIEATSQAHIHQGAVGENGGVVAFLASNDPSVSGDFEVEGTIRPADLIGIDWATFAADLAAGNLYVNVHTSANPGGELRGQIAADTDATVNASFDVPAGASLFGWFADDTDSGTVLGANAGLTGIWWLSPVDGWVLDAPILPDAFRNDIAINTGTGILLLADEATTIDVPLAHPNPDLTAALAALDGSGVSGVATLSAYGDGTRIRVAVAGLTEGAHANHVHHGSCAAQGEIHVPLNDLGAGADGDANGATVWADNGIDHFSSGHYVAVHELVTFAVITCGDVQ